MKIVNASFFIKKDKKDKFIAVLMPLIDSSRLEHGCLSYNLFESFEEPGHFIMVEHWKNQEAINEHNKNPLLIKLLKNIPSFSYKQPSVTVSSRDN